MKTVYNGGMRKEMYNAVEKVVYDMFSDILPKLEDRKMPSDKILSIMVKFFMEQMQCAEGMAIFLAEKLMAELEDAEVLR